MTVNNVPERVFVVVAQEWEESERGWGCRPDGFTLHLSMAAAGTYLLERAENERKNNPSGVVPEEYTRPCGIARPVDVDAAVHNRLLDMQEKGTPTMWINNLAEVEPFSKKEARAAVAKAQALAAETAKLRKEAAFKSGLAKLTAEEKEALGLSHPAAPADRDINRGWRSV